MQSAVIPPSEPERLAALRGLGVLDSGPEEEFDALVRVASLVCGVPVSLISLVDAERQWFKANIGLPGTTETPRDIAFCSHAILDDALFVVNDATSDPRFADNPLVLSQPDIRFYAGAPIVLGDGSRIGTLCVIDRQPRTLDLAQSEILRSLAVAAAQALEGRRAIREMQVLSRELEKNKALLDRTGNLAGVGAWEVDLVKGAIYWSDETCRIHGVPPGYVPDMETAIHFYAPEARPTIQGAVTTAIASGEGWDLELQLVRADGVRIWVRAVGSVEFANGQPVRLLGAFQDVTARRSQQTTLEDAQERILLATESGGIGIWDMDMVTREVHWDAQSYRLHGLEPHSRAVTVDLWTSLLHPDDRQRSLDAFQTALASGADYVDAFRVVWPDGSVRHLKGFGRMRLDALGQPVRVVGTNIDVTEAVHYAQSLEEARDKAEEATQSKGQFLANMSHEIRTPMNAILGMLKLLGNTPLNSNQFDYLHKTEGAANSLLGLLNDILDFSKIDAGKMELDLRPLRLDRLLRELAVVLSANVGSKAVEVLYDIDPAIPQTLIGDAMRLRQVLINLAGNAIKFTSVGQVVVSLRLDPAAGGHAGAVGIAFAVKDTGIGIAPENQARIFSGFSQAESSTSRRFGGTGLGLAISQRLVELMGGQVKLESALGAGSTFSFSLQLGQAAPDAQHPAMPPNATHTARPLQSSNRVLVVDDNPVALELMSKMMRSFGWQVDEARGGQDALERIQTQPVSGGSVYQCIYLDWQMPSLNGWDTLQQMQALPQFRQGTAPKIIMLSANGRDDLSQRTQSEQSLLNAFLVKPVTASMLFDASLDQSADSETLRRTPRSSKRQLSGMRVLVAEDNAINQQVAEELLSFEGALVSIVGDGRQAVNAVAAATQQFHAVLMDVQMPVMDGYAATRVIRTQLGLERLPIIGLTANAMASDREACLDSGMDEHIGKPFDLAHLVSLLITLTGFVAGEPQASAARAPLPYSGAAVADMDLPAALSRLGGLKQVYVRAAVDMKSALAASEQTLEAFLKANDLRGAETLLHTLKGNAGTLGLTRLAATLAALEKLCRGQDDVVRIRKKARLLGPDVASAQQALDAAVRTLQEAEPEPAVAADPESTGASVDALAQALEIVASRLVPLLEAQDLTVLEVFAEARGALQALPPAHINPLETALQELDLDAALRVCRAMAKHEVSG